ncbi:tail assembly chaperone [Bacillus phage Bobb]|uniref:Tail assembly chaperone protein n=1 Tax=Bacillus phage Bobb TaxID=1527469 RepID=A0A076GDI5_9CAUD|nr:tail assembly chaperone [Bacillus phage Bobb]AII28080.1 tail assembly chaperone protein [Bacillus phage Bobb]
MRNLWAIMKTFNVLPTDPNFLALTDHQIHFMIMSMNEDAREMELARKGLTVDSEHYDTNFEDEVWNREVGDWDVLKDGHDADDIAKQVEKLTKQEDMKNLDSKFDGLDEYNQYREDGGQTVKETEVEQYMNKRLQEALDKAKDIEAAGGKGKLVDDRKIIEGKQADSTAALNKEVMDKSIALFNGDEDDDDDFTAL